MSHASELFFDNLDKSKGSGLFDEGFSTGHTTVGSQTKSPDPFDLLHGPTHELQTITNAGANTPVALQHDAKGNLTQDERGCSLIYDSENMMSGFLANTRIDLSDASYLYDAYGRRVAKYTTSCETVYVHSGPRVIFESTVAASGAAVLRSCIVYGVNIDEPLIINSAVGAVSSTLFYHANRQFSTYAVTTMLGSVAEWYAYSPFGLNRCFTSSGAEASATPATTNRSLYTARTLDSETNLQYFRARYYSPGIGTFTTRDPYLYPDGANTYAAWFAPSATDPNGMAIVPGLWPTVYPIVVTAVVGVVGYWWITTSPPIDIEISMPTISWPILCATRNPAQDKPLSKKEIRDLQDAGIDIHDLKTKKGAAHRDLYKDKEGNVYVKPKGDSCEGECTGLNIYNLPKPRGRASE